MPKFRGRRELGRGRKLETYSCILYRSRQMDYYTNMKMVFDSINNEQVNYDWMISDFDCNYFPEKFQNVDSVFLSGQDLTDIVTAEEVQFIWAVFSGFEKTTKLTEKDLAFRPISEDGESFWKKKPKIQHPKATIEIVSWDSSAVLLLSTKQNIIKNFRERFSDAQDLRDFNLKNWRR
jgi:hypothetical protein